MIKFKIALLDDKDNIISATDAGYVGRDFAGVYACEAIKPFLEGCDWSGKEIVLLNPFQMLNNQELMRWHNFRLNFLEHGKYNLTYNTNTGVDVLFESSFPNGWGTMDDDEKQFAIEQLAAEIKCR